MKRFERQSFEEQLILKFFFSLKQYSFTKNLVLKLSEQSITNLEFLIEEFIFPLVIFFKMVTTESGLIFSIFFSKPQLCFFQYLVLKKIAVC